MSVQKPDFNSLIKEEIPFTIIPNYVLQSFNNPLALSVWCYLISLPSDWIVNRKHLAKHFNVGRDRINTAIKSLKDNFLIGYKYHRNSDGTMGNVSIIVNNGTEYLQKIVNSTTALKTSVVDDSYQTPHTTTLKIQAVDNPGSGESAPTNNIINKKEKNIKDTSSNDDSDLCFFDFWSCYPKKVGKKESKRAWDKISITVKKQIISDISKRKDNNWKGTNNQFIPNPATYLKNERWEDDIIASYAMSSSQSRMGFRSELRSTVPPWIPSKPQDMSKRSKPPIKLSSLLKL